MKDYYQQLIEANQNQVVPYRTGMQPQRLPSAIPARQAAPQVMPQIQQQVAPQQIPQAQPQMPPQAGFESAFERYIAANKPVENEFKRLFEDQDKRRLANDEAIKQQRAQDFSGVKHMDLSPIANLVDNLTGSNLLRGYNAPTSKDKRDAEVARLQRENKALGSEQNLSRMSLAKMQSTSAKDAAKFLMERKKAGGNGGLSISDMLKLKRIEAIDSGLDKRKTAIEANKVATTNLGQVMIRDINTAINTIDENGLAATGWGSFTKALPGTPAHKLKADLDSVRGTVAVDQLLQIKKSGAGLGQVPQSQLNMLATLMGSLDQAITPGKLRSNLRDIEDIYSDIVRREGGDPHELYRESEKRKRAYAEGQSNSNYDSEIDKINAEIDRLEKGL